ncbi:ABC transporter substrate-binding protein [Microbacterium sp.]|uniref:ABC transporter substrate-binding protein n=1 Tax=Microbacterium sp. TaxID=51671 RepID=UPI0039E4EC11
MTPHRRSRAVRMSILTIAAASALALSACSGTGTATETQTDTKEFSLAFGVSNEVETGYETLAKQYMEENEGVTITINGLPGETYGQTIRTQLAAGNASDVFITSPGSAQVESIIPLAEAGLLEPLGDTAASVIPSGAESMFTVDGKVYGQALDIVFIGNVFNTMPGVAYPTDFASVLSTCEELKAQGTTLFVVAGSVGANAGIMAQTIAATRVYADEPDWNDQRLAGDVTFADSDGWKATLEAIVQMHDAGCFQDGVEGAGFDAITNGLTQGTSLGMFGPSGTATEINKAADGHASFVVEAFPPATASDKSFGIASSTYAYSIAANSKNKVAAKKFLEWMAEPAQAKALADDKGTLPVSGIADLDLTDTVYAPVSEFFKNGDYVPLPNSAWPKAAVYDALGAGVQGLFTGQKTVDQVLQDMDNAWDN